MYKGMRTLTESYTDGARCGTARPVGRIEVAASEGSHINAGRPATFVVDSHYVHPTPLSISVYRRYRVNDS